MMKPGRRIPLIALLAAAFVFLLAGCGSTEPDNPPADTTPSAQAEASAGSASEQQTDDAPVAHSMQLPVLPVSMNSPDNDAALRQRYGLSIEEVGQLAGQPEHYLRLNMQADGEGTQRVQASGEIALNGITEPFALSGSLTPVQLDNGDQCYAGGLSGYLNGMQTPENALTLSVNWNETSGDCNVMAQIGVGALSLDFGTYFDGMNEIFEKLRANA